MCGVHRCMVRVELPERASFPGSSLAMYSHTANVQTLYTEKLERSLGTRLFLANQDEFFICLTLSSVNAHLTINTTLSSDIHHTSLESSRRTYLFQNSIHIFLINGNTVKIRQCPKKELGAIFSMC